MLRDIRKNKVFNRRALFIGAAQATLGAALVSRLTYLQVFKKEEYTNQADSNRIKAAINPAPRGIIYDRHNSPLTRNDSNYRLLLYYESKKNIEELVDRLVKILDLDEEKREHFLTKIKNARRKSIISLMDNLAWDDLSRVEVNSYALPGISIESGIIRRYPYPFETSHFVGYVSLPSSREIDNNEQNLYMHPDFRVGKTGIEKSFDDVLRGKHGMKYVEVNALEIPVRTLSVKPPKEGQRVPLTIDINLQKFVTDRVKDQTASVVVLDVKTGEILSYVSSPSFNPNNFVEGVSRKYWNEVSTNKRRPLHNKPISALYPPGSPFKLMVALAALEAGIDPEEKVTCDGHFKLGRRDFHCWKREGHGPLNMSEAIMHSCNTYFFEIGNRIGIDKFGEMARRFGYGDKFDINLAGVKSGNVPSDKWKRKRFKRRWVGGDTLNTSIGQGFSLATPLQMAIITARIANGGVPIAPHLVKSVQVASQFNRFKSKSLVKKEHIDIIQDGMNRVVNEAGGTAYGKRIEIDGFEMAGKTGTSQVTSRKKDHEEREKSTVNSHQNHAIFVGYAPTTDPKYAVSVVVEHGRSGSAAAAPIARDVLLEAQKLGSKKFFS